MDKIRFYLNKEDKVIIMGDFNMIRDEMIKEIRELVIKNEYCTRKFKKIDYILYKNVEMRNYNEVNTVIWMDHRILINILRIKIK